MIDQFLGIKLHISTLDRYYIRTAIFKALQQSLSQFHGVFLDVGCGKMPYRQYILNNSNVREYIGLDIESAIAYDPDTKPDYTWDGIAMPFDNEKVNCAMATEVLEHCPDPEITLKEIHRVLKPGGVFFFTVPFLWNLHEVPHDEYRYTPFSLERHLRNSGFSNIQIRAYGGWHASMAQMLGLWVRRSPLSRNKRKILSFFLKPVMSYLIRIDEEPVRFNEGKMIPGLYGVARK